MPGGPIFGALFFGSLAMAGFTSLLSILQVVSAGFQEKFGWTPRQASVRLGVVSAIISVLLFSTTTGLVALDTADQWANNVGIVGSAVLMSVLLLWVLRRGPELRYHLNAVSTFRLGPWWQVLVAVLAPLVLGYMLVSRIVTLVVDGYEGYPAWYLALVGWGAIAFMVLAALVLTALRWRRSPDDFVPGRRTRRVTPWRARDVRRRAAGRRAVRRQAATAPAARRPRPVPTGRRPDDHLGRDPARARHRRRVGRAARRDPAAARPARACGLPAGDEDDHREDEAPVERDT